MGLPLTSDYNYFGIQNRACKLLQARKCLIWIFQSKPEFIFFAFAEEQDNIYYQQSICYPCGCFKFSKEHIKCPHTIPKDTKHSMKKAM